VTSHRFLNKSRFHITGDNSMRRALVFLTLFILLAFCTSCDTQPTGSPPLQKSAKITVYHPNLFLQDDRGKVTFEIEQVFGKVNSTTTTSGNTSQVVDQTDVNIWPEADAAKYDVYIEVELKPTGLTATDPLRLRKLYRGGERLLWEWNLEPAGEMAEGAEVSFQFGVDVTWEARAPDVRTEKMSGVWKNEFRMKVGPPASRVNAALYSSPVLAAGGLFAFGTGIRRRKKLLGAELEEEGIEDNPEVDSKEAELEEEVSSTVYAPGQAGQGDSFLVQVFVHLPEQAAGLDELAKEADDAAKQRMTTKLKKTIKRGTELTFHLTMPGLEIDEPAQSCTWEGEPVWTQFGVTIPPERKPGNIIGTVIVSEASIPIGHLKFKFKIAGSVPEAAPAPVNQAVAVGNMTRYKQAFISYTSKDRAEVLKRVQMLNLVKVKFFQDLLTLEPGDAWEKLLYDYIDQSDVFYLFWSQAASESEWVRKEIAYAIKRKGGNEESAPEIVPVIIEGPPAARPPAELSFLHFNDKLMYFINTRETEAKPLDG
jgi:hypothetical protein